MPANGNNGPFTYIVYNPDFGAVAYVQKMNRALAVSIGNSLALRGASARLPRSVRYRRIHGKAADGITTCTACVGNTTNAKYQNPFTATFTDNKGTTFTGTGTTGEDNTGR
jgi:hypothetical protein